MKWNSCGGDGRGGANKGSIDDDWVQYGNRADELNITGGWAQHTWSDAIGDYMKTRQSVYGSTDGSTWFYDYNAGTASKLTCSDMENLYRIDDDGTLGRRDFYVARGYTVTECYNQRTCNTASNGLSLEGLLQTSSSSH